MRRARVVALFAALATLVFGALGGCGQRAQETQANVQEPEQLPAAAPVSLTVVQSDGAWGSIKGRIVWGGADIPKREEIKSVDQNADKAHCLSKGPILSEHWVVNDKNKGLRWTFVSLAPDPESGKKDLPIHPKLQKAEGTLMIDQPLCVFSPHALGVREGQTVIVKNPAPMPHNFKYGGNPEFNPGDNFLMPPNTERELRPLKADPKRIPVKMECNIHPWMNGWIHVFNHPYFAVTDENGAFEIKDAPAGKLRLMVRHDDGLFLGGAAGRQGRPITIEAGKTIDLGAIEFAPPK